MKTMTQQKHGASVCTTGSGVALPACRLPPAAESGGEEGRQMEDEQTALFGQKRCVDLIEKVVSL